MRRCRHLGADLRRRQDDGHVLPQPADDGILTAGGTRPDRAGWFVAPTIFSGITNDQTIAREEILGPVLAYDDED
ncbi:aldehyde dehydrogenase family protein [Nocardia sp. CA-151230]|uniref:aldehyde dehydrogenase family protein n=1 Tax=Nocardia sp. CA-151230 TaxID=3239982 RepID=UPI003D8A93F2